MSKNRSNLSSQRYDFVKEQMANGARIGDAKRDFKENHQPRIVSEKLDQDINKLNGYFKHCSPKNR